MDRWVPAASQAYSQTPLLVATWSMSAPMTAAYMPWMRIRGKVFGNTVLERRSRPHLLFPAMPWSSPDATATYTSFVEAQAKPPKSSKQRSSDLPDGRGRRATVALLGHPRTHSAAPAARDGAGMTEAHVEMAGGRGARFSICLRPLLQKCFSYRQRPFHSSLKSTQLLGLLGQPAPVRPAFYLIGEFFALSFGSYQVAQWAEQSRP